MSKPSESDDAVVERARRRLVAATKFRWIILAYGIFFLAFAVYCTLRAIYKLEALETQALSAGFVYGIALGVLWLTFGLLGGLCIGKFLAGWQKEFREPELLVRYYDRLRELQALPGSAGGTVDKSTQR